mmetsp:Transcript_21729/g.48629  ORF Transcript_21729/g.48629 Transcript_21729/m.48629 type:complete len:159 (-) Transcript_21729:59-535(-)
MKMQSIGLQKLRCRIISPRTSIVVHVFTLLHLAVCLDTWLRISCEMRFWFRVISSWDSVKQLDSRIIKCLVATRRDLQNLQTHCIVCAVGLDGTTRKLCKGCKTYCYCSRECQELHWNMPGGHGHRAECLGVSELNRKMRHRKKQQRAAAHSLATVPT